MAIYAANFWIEKNIYLKLIDRLVKQNKPDYSILCQYETFKSINVSLNSFNRGAVSPFASERQWVNSSFTPTYSN